MKKFLALFLSVIMALSVFAGCNQTDVPQQTGDAPVAQNPTESGEPNYLRITGAPLDKTKSRFQPFDVTATWFKALVWDRLLEYDTVKQEYVLRLAETMERSEDATTLTFTLKDAKWHDGEPVTAKDVVMTVNTKILKSGSTKGKNLKGFKEFTSGEADTLAGVVAKDEKTVVFEFDGPNYLFHEDLATNTFMLLPDHILGGKTLEEIETDTYWDKPIGSGPYMINEVNYPNYLTLTRFDDYHTGKAGVKDVLVNIYADAAAMTNAMMAGELDIYDGMTDADADSIIGANTNAKKTVIDSATTRCLQFNLSDVEGARKDLKNPKIRQALSMIIDRQAVVDYVGAQASLATTNNITDYNTDIPQWKRNLEEGKKILQAEGFDFDTPLRMFSSSTDQQVADIRDIIVASLKEAGIECTVTVDTTNAVEHIYETRDWDMLYLGGGGGGGTAGYNHFDSSGVQKAWFTEELQKVNAERYGKLLQQHSATPDEEGRAAIVDQLQVQMVEDCYQIPIWFRGYVWTIDEDFTGFEPFANDYRVNARIDTTKWALAD